jgi:hypothetical protein
MGMLGLSAKAHKSRTMRIPEMDYKMKVHANSE